MKKGEMLTLKVHQNKVNKQLTIALPRRMMYKHNIKSVPPQIKVHPQQFLRWFT